MKLNKKTQKMSLLIIIVVIVTSNAFGDNQEIFNQLYQAGNFGELEIHLVNWMNETPNDPEVYVGYFNYYLELGREFVTGTYRFPPANGRYLAMTKEDDDEIVGYMYDQIVYDNEYFARAVGIINDGIERFPNRLDMRFGIIHTLQQIGDYEQQADYLQATLRHSKENENLWMWTKNEPTPGTEDFFLSVILDYYSVWFDVSSPTSLQALLDTSRLQIELYPSNVYGYNQVALYYSNSEDHEEAAHYLSIAHELDPTDYIIVNNLAMAEMASLNFERSLELFISLRDFQNEINQEYVEERISSVQSLME